MGASIVSGGDAAPVFELREQVLNFVAGAIEGFVVGERLLLAFDRRDARLDSFGPQRGAEPVGIVAAVGDQRGRGWQGVEPRQSCGVCQ